METMLHPLLVIISSDTLRQGLKKAISRGGIAAVSCRRAFERTQLHASHLVGGGTASWPVDETPHSVLFNGVVYCRCWCA